MSVPITSSSSTATGRVTFPNAIKVKPLKFDRETLINHTQQEIDRAKEAFKLHKPNFSSTANWVVSSDSWQKADNVVAYVGRACHASFPSMGNKKFFDSVICLDNGWDRNGKHLSATVAAKDTGAKNLSSPFLSWFLYESPYGEFILNRDDFEFCRDYGFIVSGHLPHAVLMNMAIISRHFYEIHKDSFAMFNELTLNRGIDPTIAYSCIFNSYYSHYGEAYISNKYLNYSGHRVSCCYTPTTLVNLFNGVFGDVAVQKKMFLHCYTSGAKALFKIKETYEDNFARWAKHDKTFIAALNKWRKPDADLSTYKPPNPFAPRNPYDEQLRILGHGEFTFKEAFDFAIPYLDDLVRKELNK
jgi:hypothetical protein